MKSFNRFLAGASALLLSTVTFSAQSAENDLTSEEKAAGWRLLFNGKDFSGWHNFKSDAVKPGWQIKDGTMAVVEPIPA